MANTPLFVVYWLGYANNSVTLQSLPESIDVVTLFLVNLYPNTALNTNYITSDGMTWQRILDGAHAIQQQGTKVCVSIMSTPNPEISWNSISDPETFAAQVNDLVVNQWGLDGIDIDPEIGGGQAPNETFIQVVQELSKYFGPASDTGKIMSYVSYQLYLDQTLLQQCHELFDYTMLMGYFWNFDTMISQFNQYAPIVGAENLLFGISPANPQTPLQEVIQLSKWQPQGGNQGRNDGVQHQRRSELRVRERDRHEHGIDGGGAVKQHASKPMDNT